MKIEFQREFGIDAPGPKQGKYPLGNRLYHLVVMIAGLAVIATGVMMMWRVRTGLVDAQSVRASPTRRGASPTCCTDSLVWGLSD